jgi:hypothetical protein
VEGPLNNLKIYSMQFPKPRAYEERKNGGVGDKRFKIDARDHFGGRPKASGINSAFEESFLGGGDLDYSELIQMSQEFSQASLGGVESQSDALSFASQSQASISSSQFGLMSQDDDYKGGFSQDSSAGGGLESQDFTQY